MSKRFKGKPCVYCGHPHSDDGDHVVCRQFFLPHNRSNLPKVPSCRNCNKKKSDLEHYLTAVLPFGGQHSDAGATLSALVPSRLRRNAKLHSTLQAGKTVSFVSKNGMPWTQSMSIPFDSERLVALYEYIAKGLAWHHWALRLTSDAIVKGGFFAEAGRRFFETLLAMDGNSVQCDLGNGAFVYQGVQSRETPELTVWRMSLYGAVLGGDRNAKSERVSHGYVLTAPRMMPSASEFVALLNRHR